MATKRKNIKRNTGRKPFWEGLLEWILGFVRQLMIPALVLWLVTWLWVGGIFAKTGNALWGGFVDWTADQGMVVSDVMIDGRFRTDIDVLRDAIATKPGDALLHVDVDEIHRRVIALRWVREARVSRRYNGIVTVALSERVPFVVWDRPGRKSAVVDMEGRVIDGASATDFQGLLIVRGVDAPQYAADLMRMLVAEEDVARRIRGAEWVGGRRWDLIAANGTRVHLPEDDIGFALSRLAKASKDKNILARPLLSIDLRMPDRIIVESKKGEAHDVMSLSADIRRNTI